MSSSDQSAAPGLPLRGAGKESKRLKIIVAIDFGTTYSGIAFANTHEPDKQTVLKNWGRGCPSDDKVPTILRYDNGRTSGPFTWGFQARKNLRPGEKIHEWFKLGLCPEYEERRAAESELIRKYPSTTALDLSSIQVAEKLVIDYLSSLKKRVDDYFKDVDERVSRLPREYIITVPAIWDHKEQNRTRTCAERAGMGKGTQMQVVSEPEAAAIYALDRMPKIGLTEGDTFVICDAGGGTVDLASYTIKKLDPIVLAGAGKGSGGLCGSSFLNRIFAKYLHRKLRGYMGGWDAGWTQHAVDEFERRIKPEFTDDPYEKYYIMVHGLSDSRQHGISHQRLEFTGIELRENVFDEVTTKVQCLVRDQIKNTYQPVKAVLLAGGFGQNTYLRHQIEQVDMVRKQWIPVRHIEDGNTAIVRGALIAGLTRHDEVHDAGIFRIPAPRVESRIAGKSYGTCAYQIFNAREDDDSRRQPQATGEDLVERMQWFVKEGERIMDRKPKSFKFEKELECSKGPLREVDIHIFCSERRDARVAEPKYPDDLGVRECANFTMDLRDLDVPIVRHSGVDLYIAKIEIEMTLDSASLSFRGVYAKGTSKEKKFQPKLVEFV